MFLPRFRYVVVLCLDRGFAEKFTAQSDGALTVPVCQQAVIADLCYVFTYVVKAGNFPNLK